MTRQPLFGWIHRNRRSRQLGTTLGRRRLEQLEDRITPVINSWIGVSGLWSLDANWSLGHAPQAAEDVEITNGATVTHNANSDTVRSILISGGSKLDLTGGTITDTTTLTAAAADADFYLSGGTLAGATLVTGSEITGTASAGTLSGVTIQGRLDFSTVSGIYAFVSGGLTLSNGTIDLGSVGASPRYGQLYFYYAGSQTIGGTGTINFGDSASNAIYFYGSTVAERLTVASGVTIQGSSGSLGGNASFDFKGTLNADPSKVGSVLPTALMTLDSSWTNEGTLQANNGGALTLNGNWSNTGTITETNSKINLGGKFTTASVGGFARTGGTVNLTGQLVNTGDTLTLDSLKGSWNLQGGSNLDGGTLKATAGNKLVAATGMLSGVTIDGSGGNVSPFDMSSTSSYAYVGGGLTLAKNAVIEFGTVGVGPTASQLYFYYLGSQTIGGTGTIRFGDGGNAIYFYSNLTSDKLTIDSGIKIEGANGNLTSVAGFDFKGTISSDPSAVGSKAINPIIAIDGTNWLNEGKLQAVNGGTLTLNGTWSNTGTITETNSKINLGGQFSTASLTGFSRTGGTVNVTGKLLNSGNTLTLNDTTGSLNLASAGVLDGGTLKATAGNALIGATGTLNGVTLDGTGGNSSPFDLASTSSYVYVSNDLTLNNAVLNLGNVNAGATSSQLYFYFMGPQTIGGTGTINFGNSSGNAIYYYSSLTTDRLTIGPNVTIQGASGTLSGNAGFDFKGTISADPASVGSALTNTTIVIDTTWLNEGTIQARNSGNVQAQGTSSNYSAGTLTGGIWKAFANSKLRLIGANITTNAADIVLDGANSNFFNDFGTTDALTGFTTNSAAGSFTIQNGRNFSRSVAFNNAGKLTVGASSTFTVSGGLPFTHSGDLQIGGAFGMTSGTFASSGTIGGTGTYNLSSGTFNFTGGSSSLPTLLLSNSTLNIGAGSMGAADFTLRGSSTLTGDIAVGQSLTVQGNTGTAAVLTAATGFTNAGAITLTAIDEAQPVTVNVTSGTLVNSGSISVLTGTGGLRTLGAEINNSGTVSIQADTTLGRLSALHTNTGSINIASGKTLTISGGNQQVTQAAGTIAGAGSYSQSGGTFNFNGGSSSLATLLLQNAALNIGAGSTGAANFTMRGTGTLSGDVAASQAITVQGSAGTPATVTAAVGFSNAGTITLTAVDESQPVALNVTTGAITNTGHIAALNGAGGSRTLGADLTNNGMVHVTATTLSLSGALSNFAGSTLTGGVYEMFSGTFRFNNSGIGTNAATVLLDGASSGITDLASADSLANLSSNAATGSLTMQNGQNRVVGGTFNNTGKLVIDSTGAASSFTATGAFTQTGGTTTLVAGGTLASTANSVTFSGGTLLGSGSINGNVTSSATISPGASPGSVSITGDFTQTTGTLNIELTGLTAGSQFDQLKVSGSANLGGTLNVSLPGGYIPAIADSFRILDLTSAGTINGAFDGWAENTTVRLTSTSKFHVTYAGGTSNDLVLTAINIEPSLDAISNPSTIFEEAGKQTINLTGIAAGGAESQTLTITAVSNNPGLIPNPSVNYTSPNATGSLSYTPVHDQFGTAVITVTVQDNGGTAKGGIDTVTRTFTVTVDPVNDEPTLDPIADPPLILEDDGLQTINLTGISAGGGETQTLTVTATSSNPSLIPDPTVNYTSPNATGFLTYTPPGNKFGTAVITVTVTDNGGTDNSGDNSISRTFTVTVAPVNNFLATSVNALPAVTAPSFNVSWSGTDSSGVTQLAAFDIYVSTDGGAATPWLQSTTTTSGVFAGALGKHYAFYSVGIDNAGGRERRPLVPDAQTDTALFQRNLTPIVEDTKSPTGVSVATLLGASFTDADPGALRGVAITAVNGGGVWQYSTDGKAFKAMTTASETAAWLLPETYQVRFLPAANFTGNAGLVFRGWDRTWGTAATQVAVPVGEVASPFSAAGGYAQVQVTPVNDKPVVPTAAPLLLPTPRSPAVPAGQTVASLVQLATDVDGDVLGAAITGAAGKGVWEFSLDAGNTWTGLGTLSGTSALLLGPTDLVRFTPAAGATGQATLTVKAWDQFSGKQGDRTSTTVATATTFSTGSATVATKINGAPTLTGANPVVTMLEDQPPTNGVAISTLLTGRFTDDAGTSPGIAIVGANNLGNGKWQYSTKSNVWLDLGAPSASAGLLLRNTDKIRFVPNADFNGNNVASFTFRAWDQTFGTAGALIDVSTFSSGACFSNASLSASLNITPVADRPVLDISVTPALPSFLPGATPSTARVADLLGSLVRDADRVASGIAVTKVAGAGTWEFSLDGGTNWSAVGTVSASSGRLLNGDARLRFTPSATFRGVASIGYKVWDETVGTVGTMNAIAASSTAFSKEIGTATVAVNNAPAFSAGVSVAPAVPEDSKNPAGFAISTLLGAAFSDADGAKVAQGVAVTGLTGVAGGTWQFSTNGGGKWSSVGAVSDASALLLRSTDKLRFLPAANFHGQATATYRAWDQTGGAFGGRSDASTNGGSTAYSTGIRVATVDVTSINDAPAAQVGLTPGKIHLPSVPVGAVSPAGIKIGDFVSAGVVDPDGDALGIAVSGLTGTASGFWQYSTDGTTWQNIGTVSATSAFLLGSEEYIRFLPNAGFIGSAEIKFRAWDQTKGTAHARLALTSATLTGSLSTADFVAPVWVNTRPVLSAS